jgi:hypothetical protein
MGALDARAEIADADVVLLGAPNRAVLDAELPKMLRTASPKAILWIAYHKLSSPRASDLNRDVIRTLAPLMGSIRSAKSPSTTTGQRCG